MIDISTDKPGESIRGLIWQAISKYPTDAIFNFLNDKSPIVRTIAARELQIRGGKKIFNQIMKFANAKSATERELCAFILGQLGTPKYPYKKKSLPVLKKLAGDSNSSVRSAAIASFGHLGATEMKLLVIKAGHDKSPQVRVSAAAALLSLGNTTSSIKCLKKLSKDKNREVRSWAKNSIEFLLDE